MTRSAALNQTPTSNFLIYHVCLRKERKKLFTIILINQSLHVQSSQKKNPSIFTITIAMQKVFLFMHRHGIAIEIERNKRNVGVEEDVCRTQAGK